jgi:hypothetical protein
MEINPPPAMENKCFGKSYKPTLQKRKSRWMFLVWPQETPPMLEICCVSDAHRNSDVISDHSRCSHVRWTIP